MQVIIYGLVLLQKVNSQYIQLGASLIYISRPYILRPNP